VGGINWFDTYLNVERALVETLKTISKKDGEVIIATKWSPYFKSAGDIKRDVEKHIQLLEGYRIGLYMVHFPISFSPPEAEMNAMADLVETGKIFSVGVSNFNAKKMRRAYAALQKRGIPLAINQVGYSLLQRGVETDGVLETAKELGITIVAYGPLWEGLLTGKFHKNPELIKRQPIIRRIMIEAYFEKSRPVIKALEEIAVKNSATPAQVALSWLINFHGESVVAIPGATNSRQAESNAAAMRINLSEEDMNLLDELSQDLR
jgi:aryl-alcohol dehydrogenase-like predicted oxidoreductase